MSALFELSAPWWVFVLRAVAVYVLVMVLVRVSGKRAVGQFTPFDLVLLILIGNAVQNGINGGDNSLTGAVIMATTLIALNYAVAFSTSRSRRVERLIEGVPVVLARVCPAAKLMRTTFTSLATTALPPCKTVEK